MLAALALACLAGSPPAVVLGEARVAYRLSSGFEPPDYRNAGFEQQVEGSRLELHLDLSSAFSRVSFPLPEALQNGAELPPVAKTVRGFATRATAGARTQEAAVVLILEAVAAALIYDVRAPDESSSAEAALTLGRATCVGYANLAVAALTAVGIPARVVRGVLVGEGGVPTPHRWIEVHYADAGWVFSDPTASVNYVDSRHVVLRPPGREEADYDPTPWAAARFTRESRDGALLVVDQAVGEGRLARRRNLAAQRAAAVAGFVRGGVVGQDVRLSGRGLVLTTQLDQDLAFSFLALAPGRYKLALDRPGGGELQQTVNLEPYRVATFGLSLVAR